MQLKRRALHIKNYDTKQHAVDKKPHDTIASFALRLP